MRAPADNTLAAARAGCADGRLGLRFVTAVADPATASAAADPFDRLTRTLREAGLVAFVEEVHGPLGACDAVLAARAAALGRHGLEPTPCSYVPRRSDDSDPVVVCVWALAPDPAGARRVETVASHAGGVLGRLLSVPGASLLWLTGVREAMAVTGGADAVAASTRRLYARAAEALDAHGFGVGDVVRTWVRLPAIHATYAAFNRGRTDLLRTHGIDGARRPFPASTGVEGAGDPSVACLDLLAMRCDSSVERRVLARTERQHEAFAYGSAFSRGLVLAAGDERTVLVSGTASIGPDGTTLHGGDAARQADEILAALSALLAMEGARLGDIRAGTLYYAEPAARDAFARIACERGVPSLPLCALRAELCRPELALEIEAVAVVRSAPAPSSVGRHGAP